MATIWKNFLGHWGNEIKQNLLTWSKKVLDLVLLRIIQTDTVQHIALSKVLEGCNVTEYQYYEVVKNFQKKLEAIYKRNLFEVNMEPYNNVILLLFQTSMDISM